MVVRHVPPPHVSGVRRITVWRRIKEHGLDVDGVSGDV
jgi:hypothetical protein